MKAAVLCVMFLAGPAHSDTQPFVDYDLLLSQHAGEVTTRTGAGTSVYRELRVGNVLVRCKGDDPTDCISIDMNEGITDMGCTLSVLAVLAEQIERCEGYADSSQREFIARMLGQMTEHVAHNAVPPWEPEKLAQSLAVSNEKDAPCSVILEADSYSPILLRQTASMAFYAAVARAVAAPRLPVTSCPDLPVEE